MSAHSHRPKATEQTAKPTQEAPFFQAKLTVNTPGDAYEQEADAVADQVMRMQEGDAPIVQRMPLTSVGDVQRKCAACEQEEEQQAQRKETGGGDASGKAAPGIVSDVLSSGAGRPMEGGTRQFMESRFGQDFSQVRVHTDSRAAESASAIQARAYTSGRDIVFGAGQYQPESDSGKRLLAHELAHVGQQGGGEVRRTPLASAAEAAQIASTIISPGSLEVSADEMEGWHYSAGVTPPEPASREINEHQYRFQYLLESWLTFDLFKVRLKMEYETDGKGIGNISFSVLGKTIDPMYSGSIVINLTKMEATRSGSLSRIRLSVDYSMSGNLLVGYGSESGNYTYRIYSDGDVRLMDHTSVDMTESRRQVS